MSWVSHCYQRRTREGWPYNLYTTIHRQTREECYTLVRQMAEAVGINGCQLLFSIRELKKCSMAYFMDDAN
ncbi:hypothetical protein [Desulfotomaculum nigrificans]|uniref:hypothetical protein n=1 Tax=Desulfotomaculum nigrificans TaxID=1565 RepID=UPI0018DF63E2|nr:hypothetical protein [Desulfotomaculum nigrificans]